MERLVLDVQDVAGAGVERHAEAEIKIDAQKPEENLPAILQPKANAGRG